MITAADGVRTVQEALCAGGGQDILGELMRPKAGQLTSCLKGISSPFGPQLLAQAGLVMAAQCLEFIE